jgi:hypothetical protein
MAADLLKNFVFRLFFLTVGTKTTSEKYILPTRLPDRPAMIRRKLIAILSKT